MKIVEKIRRTGSAQSTFRYLVAVDGEGKKQVRQLLTPAIEKVGTKEEFRFGSRHIPIEQYGFRVFGVTYERFADAASEVLCANKVRVSMPYDAGTQIYVRKAHSILDGQDKIRILDPSLSETYRPMAA